MLTVTEPLNDQNVDEDKDFHFEVPVGTFASDRTGSELAYSVQLISGEPLPSWLSFNYLTATFNGSPSGADVGQIEVLVSVFDLSFGDSISDTVSITVNNINDAPEGELLISGEFEAGRTLLADTSQVSDEDGISEVSFQWLRDGAPIEAATNHSYVIEDGDAGSVINLSMSYLDNMGTMESVTTETIEFVTLPEIVSFGPSLILANILVNSYTTHNQIGPQLVSLSSEKTAVLWSSFEQDGDGSGLYGRIVDNGGNFLSEEFILNTTTAGWQSNVSAAAFDDGRLVAVWRTDDDGRDSRMAGQIFDRHGQKIGAEFFFDNPLGGDVFRSFVQVSSSEFFVFASVESAEGSDITFVQKFDMEGASSGNSFVFEGGSFSSDYRILSEGRLLHVWSDFGESSMGDDSSYFPGPFLRIVDENGESIGPIRHAFDGLPPDISNGTSGFLLDIVGLDDGGHLIVWDEIIVNGNQDVSDKILVRRIDAGGNFVDDLVELELSSFDASDVRFAATSDGLMAIQQADNDPAELKAYYFDADGRIVSEDFLGISDESRLRGLDSGLVLNGFGDSGFLLAWHQLEEHGIYEDIYLNSFQRSDIHSLFSDPFMQPILGETLPVGSLVVSDEEGVAKSTVEFQWFSGGREIIGATELQYVPSISDLGSGLSLEVSFLNGLGNFERHMSLPSKPVVEKGLEITFNDDVQSLSGSSGNDIFLGSIGVDFVVLSGRQSGYTLHIGPDELIIEDRRDFGDGVDRLSNIEFLDFEANLFDEPFNLSKFSGPAGLTSLELESFIELYIAYFNRAPDAVGLNFWGTAFANGTTLEEMAALFGPQDETLATYPEGTSNNEFATTVYNNVLGRTPDQAGIDFWVGQLDAGNVSRDQFILQVLQGAKSDLKPELGQDFVDQQIADQAFLEAKTDIGAYFAVHKGMSDVPDAIAAMALFDGSENGTDAAVAAIEGFYVDAIDAETGEFLMPLVGVLDDPFSIA
jgi:Domain of unknown function (DUF4214)/Putative Ig domain